MHPVRQRLAAFAAACLVAACGGGETEILPATFAIAAAPAATHVRLEGCVLDATDHPLALPVQATDSDGRLLASAMTGSDGVFRLHVPARAAIRLAAAAPGAEPLTVLTGNMDLTVTACLRPSLA